MAEPPQKSQSNGAMIGGIVAVAVLGVVILVAVLASGGSSQPTPQDEPVATTNTQPQAKGNAFQTPSGNSQIPVAGRGAGAGNNGKGPQKLPALAADLRTQIQDYLVSHAAFLDALKNKHASGEDQALGARAQLSELNIEMAKLDDSVTELELRQSNLDAELRDAQAAWDDPVGKLVLNFERMVALNVRRAELVEQSTANSAELAAAAAELEVAQAAVEAAFEALDAAEDEESAKEAEAVLASASETAAKAEEAKNNAQVRLKASRASMALARQSLIALIQASSELVDNMERDASNALLLTFTEKAFHEGAALPEAERILDEASAKLEELQITEDELFADWTSKSEAHREARDTARRERMSYREKLRAYQKAKAEGSGRAASGPPSPDEMNAAQAAADAANIAESKAEAELKKAQSAREEAEAALADAEENEASLRENFPARCNEALEQARELHQQLYPEGLSYEEFEELRVSLQSTKDQLAELKKSKEAADAKVKAAHQNRSNADTQKAEIQAIQEDVTLKKITGSLNGLASLCESDQVDSAQRATLVSKLKSVEQELTLFSDVIQKSAEHVETHALYRELWGIVGTIKALKSDLE